MKEYILKILLLVALFTTSAFANIQKAPKNFSYLKGMATFIDVTTIDSEIEYNIGTATVTAVSRIEFEMSSEGYPIFDLIPSITSLEIDGIMSEAAELLDPTKTTRLRVLNKKLKSGTHTLIVRNEISTNLKFAAKSVRSAFWMSDLEDRKYIEQYLPTNFEYDQYQQTLEIKVMGETDLDEHKVYTNGKLKKVGTNHFKITFPEYFTASSLFFHMVEKGAFEEIQFTYNSISGKKIPVVAYKKYFLTPLALVKSETLETLKELENNFGAWSHPSLTIYIAGSGGMEYSGATITSRRALGHELTHSFYARGVMPVNGNSGWIDEAIASWRDNSYNTVNSPNFSSTSMASHSIYRRTTDRRAYTQGANFMAYLNKRLETQGGLIKFLADFYKDYKHTNITTNVFKKELEQFSGIDFTKEFNQYIFGMAAAQVSKSSDEFMKNPNHPKLSKKQLLDIL